MHMGRAFLSSKLSASHPKKYCALAGVSLEALWFFPTQMQSCLSSDSGCLYFVLGGSTSLGAEVPHTLNSFRVLPLALGGAAVCVINRYMAMAAASRCLEAMAAFQNLPQIKMIDPSSVNPYHQTSLGIRKASDSS